MTAWAILHLVATVVVSGAFLVSGATKLRGIATTRETITALGLPSILQRDAVARLYPVAEILLGMALLALPAPAWWIAAAGGAALMAVLTVLVVRVVRSGQAVSCNCFGATQVLSGRSVARNAVLLALSLATVASDPLTTAPVVEALRTAPDELLAIVTAVLTTAVVTALITLGPGLPKDAETFEDRVLEVPEATVRDSVGREVDLRGVVAGGPVLLVNVKTGCSPCATVIETLRDGDLIAERVRVRLLERTPADGTLDRPRLWDDAGAVAQLLGLQNTPSALLIAADGTIPADPVRGSEQIFALVRGIEEAVAAQQPRPLDGVDL